MSDHLERHIIAAEAMRFLDGEMTPEDHAKLQHHIDGCPQCEALMISTHDCLEGLPEILTEEARRYSDAQAAATQRMRVRLAAEVSDTSSWISRVMRRGGERLSPGYAVAAAAVVVLAVGVGLWQYSHHVEAAVAELPNRALTPGAVRAVALEELCSSSEVDDDLDPIVQPSTEKVVFREYGLSTEATKKSFQVDYLINPQLGGVDDVRNLWPQPYDAPEWNAKAKDLLERHLHQMVCERQIELADAQREIAENWIDAYKKYFHTSKPI